MKTRIIFFANIREVLGTAEVELDLPEGCRLPALLSLLNQQFGDKAEILKAENTRIAVNQEIVRGSPLLDGALEIAFFPPVTGG